MNRAAGGRRGLPVAGVAPPADRRFHRADLVAGGRRSSAGRYARIARRLLPSLIVVAAGCVLLQAAWSSSFLRVRGVHVEGNTRLSQAQVESLLSGIQDEQIFSVDLEAYRARLLDSPWVADASLSRVLPATVHIVIVEHAPMAVARHDSQLYLVDERGSIIDDYGPTYRNFDLPVVDGLMRAAKDRAPVPDPAKAALAASLLSGLSARPDLSERISQVDVSNAHDAVVMFDDDAAWVHLGDRDFLGRLERYVELRPTFIERFGLLDYVDLRFDKQVYLRGRGRVGIRRAGSN
jgi:cell division septal protein FtsQ